MSPPPTKKLKKASSPSPDADEPLDIFAFQASLDESYAAAQTLVDTWVPSNFDPSWDDDANKAQKGGGLALLESQSRPARLGLGASASAYHVRQAEERKLKNQLLSHAKKHGKQDEESRLFAPKVSPSKRAALDDATDSDDEESRAGSIKKKKAPAPDNGATSSEASTSTPKKAASLFNPPTPAAASPSPAKTGLKPVVGASFYGNASSNGASALAGLSKNQRKKERERLRKLETQRAKEDESRREAEAEAKRLLADVGDDQEVDIEDSVDLAVPVSGLDEPSKAEGDDDDDAVGEQASPAGADSAGKASTGVASPGKSANGTAEEGKKKKKRRRKSKAAAQQESPRLLNL